MSNKQKLPKHITAHESLQNKNTTSVILKNERTRLYFSSYKDCSWSLKRSVIKLNKGFGWPYNKDIVGKQIVF